MPANRGIITNNSREVSRPQVRNDMQSSPAKIIYEYSNGVSDISSSHSSESLFSGPTGSVHNIPSPSRDPDNAQIYSS